MTYRQEAFNPTHSRQDSWKGATINVRLDFYIFHEQCEIGIEMYDVLGSRGQSALCLPRLILNG